MATADQVVVELQAKTDTYLRNIKNAEQQFVKGMDRIEAEAAQAGSALATVGARGSQAFQQAASHAPRAAAAIRDARMHTANLAAQINDIGVTLASGQSPFLVAIQQGTQINQVIGQTGAAGAVRMLAGAFTSLINPVSLATIGIITLGGFAVQYFAQLLSDSSDAEETLKEQEALIKRVADRWGEAYPALKKYVDEIERQKQESDQAAANQILIAKEWEGVRGEIDAVANATEDLLATLLFDSTAPVAQIAAVRSAYEDLEAGIRDGSATAEDAQRVQQALSDLYNSTLNPAVQNLADQFRLLANAIGQVGRATAEIKDSTQLINEANERYIADAERRNKLTAEQLRLENEIARVKADVERHGGSLDDDAARGLALSNLAAEDRRRREARQIESGGSSRSQAAAEADRERQAVADLIADLEFERSLIGMSAVEKEKANALRRAGAAATDEERARIATLTEQIYNETTALKEQQQAYEELKQIGVTAVNSIATAFADGKLEAEEMIQIVIRLIEQLLTMKSIGGGGIFDFLGGLLGGGGGTMFANDIRAGNVVGLYHTGGVVGRPSSRRRVTPGVFSGAPRYHDGGIAGLKPGEVPAILQKGEVVLPRGAAATSRNGGKQQVQITVDVTGARGNKEIEEMVAMGVRQGIDQYRRFGVQEDIASYQRDPRKRG